MSTKEQQDFINKIVKGAQKGYEKYGVFASVTIAQACLESTWGTSPLARRDNNLFGIKYGGNHDPSLTITQGSQPTDGTGGYYAHYESWDDSVQDHGYFLKNNSRYTDAGAFNATTPEAQITSIENAGYAVNADGSLNEQYVPDIMATINANNLIQYDTGTYTGGDSANSNSDTITVEATNYQVVANSEKTGDVFFGRRYRITVSDDNGNALDVSDLHCTFNIVKTIQMEPNSSEITIYNLNVQTENAIMMTGKRVTVEAGYEGTQFGLIFDGDILQTIREREDGTTCSLTIIALDSDRAINFEIVNFSIARGQTARSIIDHIANKASNPIPLGSISDKLKGQTFTRGKVVFGKASDYIRQIAKSYDLHCYMDDGTLNLISMDELPEGEIFELSPTSGLIGTPTQTDYGISGQCLLNPQIKLNSLIHIDNSLVRAKRVDVTGSNSMPATTSTNDSNIPSVNNVRSSILKEAKKLADDPNVHYSEKLRGQTVDGITYYDCSAFTQHCYSVAGLEINPTSETQYAQCQAKGLTNISLDAAIPGDLVFWFHGDDAYHVAIYAGNNSIYAASTDQKPADDQVLYESLYGQYVICRPESLIKADGGELPSANNNTDNSGDTSQSLFRSLDKDGIYRVIKITYEGDTRGNDWYVNFETIDQLGGAIAAVSN
ncbi:MULTISPECIES: glucosaminidase domain-containing protein [unclassified Clostridium]|uniref:phage protein n=1 Tax=unclassified Clostridium TaxID=2614128 RepID=UPI000297C505|nr:MULTISPECIES: glucosaminidase domain-containing protein [unclassified Clostridium]EKQ56263.1 MAG: muramidase (flagellum-specific) [Clostridium sp. Maddingley MBC34-26]